MCTEKRHSPKEYEFQKKNTVNSKWNPTNIKKTVYTRTCKIWNVHSSLRTLNRHKFSAHIYERVMLLMLFFFSNPNVWFVVQMLWLSIIAHEIVNGIIVFDTNVHFSMASTNKPTSTDNTIIIFFSFCFVYFYLVFFLYVEQIMSWDVFCSMVQ